MFTSTPYEGNGLAVVLEADDFDERTMLAFARETRLSETTFVQTATEPGADYRNRIFDAFEELPFAGHPSLGTAVAVARRAAVSEASYVQQTRSGLQRIEVELDGLRSRASMLQPPAQFGEPIDPARVLSALSLGARDAHPELPVVTGTTGLRHLLVPLRDETALAGARADVDEHRALVSATGTFVTYAFVADGDAVRARGFLDTPSGISEDPATGSAAGPLAAYLKQHAGAQRIVITQGDQIGRPSRLEAEVVDDGINVGGEAVIIFEGTLAG